MASTNDKPEAGAAGEAKTRGVADYLSENRKKRKSYVLLALGKSVPADLGAGMESFIRAQYKNMAIAQPKTPADLIKQLGRQVVLLIYDDEFASLDDGLKLISDMKRRKSAQMVPVLFLTRQPENLIEAYNRLLLPFHEMDEYLNLTRATPAHVYSKIKLGMVNKNRRRSRRYKIDMPIKFMSLVKDEWVNANLIDLSMHGAMLRADESRIFRAGEQIKIEVPVSDYLSSEQGDYLKLSAKVRRVFISGNSAGLSFEHLSDRQTTSLTKLLTEIVNGQQARRATLARSKAPRG